ncbi:MAG: hypothetical protein WA806_06530, partial [Bradyrhizobium sp.]
MNRWLKSLLYQFTQGTRLRKYTDREARFWVQREKPIRAGEAHGSREDLMRLTRREFAAGMAAGIAAP